VNAPALLPRGQRRCVRARRWGRVAEHAGAAVLLAAALAATLPRALLARHAGQGGRAVPPNLAADPGVWHAGHKQALALPSTCKSAAPTGQKWAAPGGGRRQGRRNAPTARRKKKKKGGVGRLAPSKKGTAPLHAPVSIPYLPRPGMGRVSGIAGACVRGCRSSRGREKRQLRQKS